MSYMKDLDMYRESSARRADIERASAQIENAMRSSLQDFYYLTKREIWRHNEENAQFIEDCAASVRVMKIIILVQTLTLATLLTGIFFLKGL